MEEDHHMEVDPIAAREVLPEVLQEAPKVTPSPLTLDLGHQVRLFLGDLNQSNSVSGSLPQAIYDYARGNGSTQQLLSALSVLAADDGLFELVEARFEPVLLDILARWFEPSAFTDSDLIEKRLSVLAKLAETSPQLWSLIYTFILQSPFRASPFSCLGQQNLTAVPAPRLHSLLLAYIRLIIVDPFIASRNDWSIIPLHALRTEHPDAGVRLLAIQVLSKQRKWSETKRMEMESAHVGAVEATDVKILFGHTVNVLPQGGFETQEMVVDGWLMPIFEAERIKKARKSTNDLVYASSATIAEHDLSSRTALVADHLILRNSPPNPSLSITHVRTEPMDNALRTLCPLVQLTAPILLTSPPSSGKSHILQYLSCVLFPNQRPSSRILTIPLADTSIDVKSLIGTYISSPTKPGTFEWMEGALAKAIRAGRWVVFEDVDRGSTEMLVTLAGIARSLRSTRPGKRATLAVPGREDVEAGEGFGLFVTRTIRQGYTPPSFYGHHIFTETILEAPSDSDILAFLSARFERLPRSITTTLVDIWHQLRPFDRVSGQVKARDIGLRDLEKWCARVVRNLPPSASLAALEQSGSIFANTVLQDEVFLEGVDIFVASLDNKGASLEKKKQMMMTIAEGLGMDEDRVLALDGRKPNFEASSASRQLHVGRVVMELAAPERSRRAASSSSRPFALTKPSLILLERVAVALALGEPTLLVGETGTGKTTAVQHIASIVRKPLTVLNLSMQTESSDLLGGFKPIDASIAARALHTRWQKLFCETFAMSKPANGSYVEAGAKALAGRKWGRCVELWGSSARRAIDKLGKGEPDAPPAEGSPLKRRKISKATRVSNEWQGLLADVTEFDLHHAKMKSKLVFSFVEGPLVKAIKSGEWILLDEVNLASQETLEAISTILEGPTASLVLTERGDVEPIERHPQFRLFACMNPATDVGKKDLPPNLRARFTELYVPPPDDDREALLSIVSQYLGDAAAGDKSVVLDVAELYTTLKKLCAAKEIVDGSNAPPHFSMRTLARALTFAVESAPLFGLRRGLWEGYLMAFTMSLDEASARIAHEAGERHVLSPMKNARAVLAQIPSLPSDMDADDYIRFGPFWLRCGPLPASTEGRYIITPSVQSKLTDLARVILTKRYPVLIQGPTSAGKTSAVEFLARQTGHRFVRINNHEHTDIQEYLGTYVTDPQTGNLVFQEGLLVTAVKQGHWIVLDELNLAPTDVLEALNRLLDDNRELVIPETQEVIKPHPNFILFATQNPPGLYAGRKILSRAFRNRFLEVHFDDVPKTELETILCQRCQIAPSYAAKIVQVFEELRHRRQASRVFESKQSFATLRDLFRWAERGAVGYQQLADDGYMLLAERARHDEDKVVIKEVIEQIMKVTIKYDMYELFDQSAGILARFPQTSLPPTSMVWTKAMQRLFALVAAALLHNEPVLLVGETGCGKTSVCEVIAHMFSQKLVGVNCHQNMETADLLGSQRPVRNKLDRKARVIDALAKYIELGRDASEDDILEACSELLQREDVDHSLVRRCQQEIKQLSALFEWSDGPLVHAMSAGDLLLLDEVSLADDSVLERLNSVLEPGRTLVLAEKGGVDIDEATIVANDKFHVVATMNPGGDFGKKELSPALRNRFTEIWVPALNDRGDLLQIIEQSMRHVELSPTGPLILDFFIWFGEKLGDTSGLGLRDILAWVSFSNDMFAKGLNAAQAFHHGGQMVLIDGLESLPQTSGMSTSSIKILREDCLVQLGVLATSLDSELQTESNLDIKISSEAVHVGGFSVPKGPVINEVPTFMFGAPTTALNTMRLVRGCQLPKAILLEGSPGVGKTSLVSALAGVAGYNLQRINLSDQTDLIDLFGSDLPVEGGQPGEFQWRDAAFLDAMQKGDWVLLDEMNLASQTVLEGLNAVLDHRGTVYIPELGKSFDRHPGFRVFAAQNPLQQGGGRKGLPKSFLNRFTKVYLQEHTPEDLMIICRDLHPIPVEMVQKMISFNETMRVQTMVTRAIGREGSPWEFNLRDLFRWFNLLSKKNGLEKSEHPVEFFQMVYRQRFRSERDRQMVTDIFENIFGIQIDSTRPVPSVTPSWLQVGHSLIHRGAASSVEAHLNHGHLEVAQSILKGIEMGWLVILAGESGIGKRTLVHNLAEAAGRELGEFSMHPGVDTSEILGSFEQQDVSRSVDAVFTDVSNIISKLSDTHPSFASQLSELSSARRACTNRSDTRAIPAFYEMSQTIVQTCSSWADTTLAQHSMANLAKLGPNAVGFAWVDGQLIHAIKNGGWFLISDANLCSASVLDRLNSLCESNGVLVLSEKGSSTGSPEILKPHADFRLFMTYDPKFGELSRAMRNRGVELYVSQSGQRTSPQDVQPLVMSDNSMLRQVDTMYDDLLSEDGVAVAAAFAFQSHTSVPYLLRCSSLPITATPSLLNEVAMVLLSASVREISRTMASNVCLSQGLESDFVESLFIDPTFNPNVHSTAQIRGTMFSILSTLSLDKYRQQQLQVWLEEPANGKTVLATSAAAFRRAVTRQKVAAGKDIYPFLFAFSELVTAHIGSIATTSQDSLTKLARILAYVQLIQEHAKSTTFDYSSTKLLAKWIEDEMEGIQIFAPVLETLRNLAKTVQLTSGMGQDQIWTLFRAASSRLGQAAEIQRLAALSNEVVDSQLRLSVLEALSVLDDASVEDGVLSQLEVLLTNSKMIPRKEIDPSSYWTNWSVVEALELAALSKNNRQALQIIVEDRNVDLSSLVSLSKSLSPDKIAAHSFQALSTWLQRVWDHAAPNEEVLSGPADLFKPTRLSASLRFSVVESIKMANIPEQDDALNFSIKTALYDAENDDKRRYEALSLVLTILVWIVSSFGVSVSSNLDVVKFMESITGAVERASQDDSHARVMGCSFEKWIKPAFIAITNTPHDLSALGSLWIAVSYFILDLYVTNIPIDPGVRRGLEGEVIEQLLVHSEAKLSAVSAAEMIVKGVSDSAVALDLQEEVTNLQHGHAALGPALERSSDVIKLSHLFNEVHAFLADQYEESRITALVTSLQNGQTHGFSREQDFQLASAAFTQRLTSNYAETPDLVHPIVTATLIGKFGIRLVARAGDLQAAKSNPALSSALSFPLAQHLQTLQNLTVDAPVDKATGVPAGLLAVSSYICEIDNRHQRRAHVPRIAQRLDYLYQSWSAIRLREQQEASDAESMYRVKKTDIEVLSDEEQEAKEFAELFPQYEDDGANDAALEPEKAEEKEKKGFLSSYVSAFSTLVRQGFGHASCTPGKLLKQLIDETIHYNFDSSKFDEEIDVRSLAFRVATLHRRQVDVRMPPSQPNFYLSHNEPEIRKAHDVLARLIRRLDVLIAEWPEQMVLVHIRERCERILNLDTRSSVAQVLSTLEYLLLHTEDWESYANRDNSLGPFRDEISKMIIEWRKLELISWTRLLDDQAEQYVSQDDEWTLRLYGALIHGAVGAEDIEKHMTETLPLISTYIKNSTLGHFASRVDLLAAFQRMAIEMSHQAPQLSKIATMLHNLLANAGLFAIRVKDSLSTQRAAIDKAIKDFVKLASWKDVNVYALKASAQKSHRALHRSIRKFRDVLRQPVAPMMMELNGVVPQEAPIPSEPWTPSAYDKMSLSNSALSSRASIAVPVPDVLLRLDETLSRYGQVHDRIRGTVTGSTASLVDTMAVDVIDTAAHLNKQTPSTLTKENEKIVNNLASRKRKAYSDMLRALRAAGFSQNVRADQLARQQSTMWLVSQPHIVIHGLSNDLVSQDANKVENYHHRMEILVAAVRAAFNGHSPDINSQDLQRGIGFVESLYATALNERTQIVNELQPLTKLEAILQRFRHCSEAESMISGASVVQAFETAQASASQIHRALAETEEGMRQLRELQGRQCRNEDLAAVHDLRQETNLLSQALSKTLDSVTDSTCSLFTQTEMDLLNTFERIRKSLVERFTSQAGATDDFRHLLVPVANMARSLELAVPVASAVDREEELWTQSDEIIQSLLVVAQQLKSPVVAEVQEDEYPHIPTDFKQQRSLVASLHISDIVERLSTFIGRLTAAPASTVPNFISRIIPFLEIFNQTYSHSLSVHTQSVKATYKLAYVIGRIVLDLAQKGFCKPQEQGDEGQGEDGDAIEGTGMGAGTGENNVSNEITEESQVEGLQGEEEEEKEENGGEDDDAFSMDEDFEGEMGEGKEKDEGSGDEEEEEEDHDEHVGDVDPLDPGAVDEKFWGDEKKEEDKKDSDELMDQQGQEEEGETEMTAKEDEKKEKQEKKEDKQKEEAGEQAEDSEQTEQKNNGDEGGDEEGEEMDDEEVPGEEHEEDGDDQPAGQDQQEVSMPEGETLDLPEDLNLDDEGMEEGQEEEDENLGDDMGMSVDGDEEEQESGQPDEIDGSNEQEGQEADDAPEATGQGEDETEEEANMGQDADLSAANEQAQESEVGKSMGGGLEGETQKEKEAEEEADAEKEEMEEGAQGHDGAAPQSQQQQNSSDQQQADGPVDSSGAPLPSDNSAQPQTSRSLGDILEKIQRRQDEILSQNEREEQPSNDQQAPEQAPGQVEYVKEDEAKEDDQQALGKAGDEERQKLEDLQIVDEEDRGEEMPAMEDNPEEGEDSQGQERPQKHAESNHQTRGEPDAEREQTEKALTQADIGGKPSGDVGDDAMEVDLDDFEGGVEGERAPIDEEDEIELNIVDPTPVSGQVATAEDIWRRYASLTSDLSYALCEQLRLILEPTLATRLQGDFRTGKRLNMRKIIPYIASEYTKDKIWLRRTKPSRREYQVLLSLDDSRSMSESHSVDLAYQTLALVSQAMNKLEVGQVSIAKFGESVDILHPFKEGGFTDADGAKVMSSFKFDQQKTDVASLVERTLSYLSEARHGPAQSASAPDLWQLQIIISDGVCQDHARLRRLLRKALEERVMIVFIIVDSLQQTAPATASAGSASSTRPSILSMQTVEYKNVGGAMKLEMQRYLDTFPFEFYVVLRDVEALPGVLADTLRQWMTRVSQSQE
ncbi:midasin [Cryptococcus wingfieldii CBS 7118]|uniref:Midasin n=1 Tax=Cryptococcus wingfieldii CBS 7118 TaxID=1295528 RepID=A0A1E3K6W9_9TREE|nr:midasin [Cryptococcus wingfieldii CBS 7118]ODO08666.1 midasin [Cryptococcus wingfieldii CBS 7118]